MLLRSSACRCPRAGRSPTRRTPGRPPRRSAPPVVVKPQYGNQGRGVATNLTTREQVLAAYANARAEGERVLVERYAPGDDYRLLVVGDRLVAAARREPAQVVGDGRSTDRPARRRGQPATPAAATTTPPS